jgi:dihydrofolate reductase
MRQLVANLYFSLDGFTGDADQTMEWVTNDFGEETLAFGLESMAGLDVLVLGRVTYEIMAAYWPTASQADPFTAPMNSIPKIVFSRTLSEDDVTWSNTRLVHGDAVKEIPKLKEQHSGDIGISGSISLVQSLLKHGVIDRLRLQVHPVALGTAGRKPLFEGFNQTNLRLVGTNVLDARVVALDYEPMR